MGSGVRVGNEGGHFHEVNSRPNQRGSKAMPRSLDFFLLGNGEPLNVLKQRHAKQVALLLKDTCDNNGMHRLGILGAGGNREASAVVQVEDQECLETRAQEVRLAGQAAWTKKGKEERCGRGLPKQPQGPCPGTGERHRNDDHSSQGHPRPAPFALKESRPSVNSQAQSCWLASQDLCFSVHVGSS